MSDLGAEYARIFGKKDDQDRKEGQRQRMCKYCGGWHNLSAWPHNCLPPAPPKPKFAAPRVTRPFQEHVMGGRIIGDPRAQRAFMDEHGLVPFDEGVKPEREQTAREWEAQFASDVKRAVQEVTNENREPVEIIGRTDLSEADEIDTSSIEVFGD